MPSYFPCPNAQCQYQFDADILPAAAMVTCPICRTKFPYRAAPAPGSEPAPAPSRDAAPNRDGAASGPRVVNLREGPNRGTVVTTILWSAGFSIVLIAVLFTVYMWNNKKSFPSKRQTEDRWNFSLDLPSGWEEDTRTRTDMNVNLFARKKEGQDRWVVMYGKDYGEREPRPAEVREELLSRFKVQSNDPDAPRAFRNLTQVELETGEWMKKPAVVYEFTADFNDVPIRGECHAISYKGIAYGCYIFCVDQDWETAKDELRDFRNKIRLGSTREAWKPKQSNTRIHTVEGARYEVEDRDDVWKLGSEDGDIKQGDYVVTIADIDKRATLAFMARHKFRTGTDTRQRSAEAFALVVELPKGGDALTTAKAHVMELAKSEYPEPPDLTFEDVKKSPGNVTLPSGGPELTRVVLRNPKDRDDVQFWVIAALNIGDKTVAIEIKTQERHAQYLEAYMVNLASSLRAK